ncbi:hypothetical protein BY458DRAFT_536268 [Sporodiniella umbellata]|nr:hypothetical protein BY458DRAFT_536268 [Sporodiniella umbellata]
MKAEYCVDYLSYKWKADDLIQTFRESHKPLIHIHPKDKCEEQKSKRLQNALWRQMARSCTATLGQTNELVNPSSVSWQKDSDITWLYGPIYTLQKNETQTHVAITVSHLEGIKPVLKKNTTFVPPRRLPTCSDEKNESCAESDSSYVSSRNNSFSSVSTTGTKLGVHFNPEIIEIEYQPERPIVHIPDKEEEEEEDKLWPSLITYLERRHSGLLLAVLLIKSVCSVTSTSSIYQRLSCWLFGKQKNKRYL